MSAITSGGEAGAICFHIELKGGRPGKELDSAVQEICNAGWEIQDWDVFGHGFWYAKQFEEGATTPPPNPIDETKECWSHVKITATVQVKKDEWEKHKHSS